MFVLVGDSVLYDGVDQDSLSRQLGVQTYTIGEPGFASAAWYLILKNIVLRASYRPKYVVILFRDTQLTAPSERTTGRYFDIMDDFAGADEPVVAQLAYINQMSPLEKLAEQYLPVYSARWKIREDLDRRIRYAAPSAFMNCSKECTDEAMSSIFGVQVDVVALNHAVEDASQILYSPQAMDFDEQVGRSFLPAMIQLAQDNGINLLFIRTKTLYFPEYSSESFALRRYIESLQEYLSKQQGVHYFDFAHDPRIKDSYFFDKLHFNAAGRQAFTQLLADQLRPLLK